MAQPYTVHHLPRHITLRYHILSRLYEEVIMHADNFAFLHQHIGQRTIAKELLQHFVNRIAGCLFSCLHTGLGCVRKPERMDNRWDLELLTLNVRKLLQLYRKDSFIVRSMGQLLLWVHRSRSLKDLGVLRKSATNPKNSRGNDCRTSACDCSLWECDDQIVWANVVQVLNQCYVHVGPNNTWVMIEF